MKKYSVVVLAALFSMPLWAHTGHGSEQPLVHSVEHGVWWLAALVALAVVWGWRQQREKSSAAKKRSSRK